MSAGPLNAMIRKWTRYGQYSVRTHLMAVALVILVPALILGGWMASSSAALERLQLEQNLEQYTREIAAGVDREITASRNLLIALATSPELQTGDLDAFRNQVQQ